MPSKFVHMTAALVLGSTLLTGCGASNQPSSAANNAAVTSSGNVTNGVGNNTVSATIPPTPNYSGQAVATYAGGTLTKQEFDQQYNLQVVLPGLASQESKKAFLTYYIVWYKYLYAKAKAEPGFQVDAATANQAAAQQLQQMVGQQYATQSALDAKMKSIGVTEGDMVRLAATGQALQNYLTKQMKSVTVSDSQAQKYYNDNKAGFVQVTVDQILVSTLKTAQEVEKKWKAGGNFTQLVSQYSQDPGAAQNHGTYANQLAISFVAPFAKACETLPLGKISDPVHTQYGYHVIRVDKRKQMTFSEVKGQIQQQILLPQLQNQKEQAIYQGAVTAAKIKQTVPDSNL
ncbi:peptidylprolyl isomerase [Alicyclobacillus ferrooxydans]|uniref:peptidylprolyl isomerase n=1 Tax=Alicyclobacillus ferrooxydans TaxID=471514 RepID=UPI0006D5A9DD|nr:peptidylprolyl isomerase [Alicyclobacillus ferrooxydans]